MNTLVLMIERGSSWSPEVWALEHGGESGIGGQVTIERATDWLSVVKDNKVLDDFDEVERTRLKALVVEPTAYLIEWQGSHLVESLFRAVPAETRAAVDNDHGLLVPVHEIASEPLESWVRANKLG